MARRVRGVIVDLEVTPDTYELRTGTAEPVRTPSAAAVRWDLATSVRTPEPGGWPYGGELWGARLTLPRDARGESAIDDPDPWGVSPDPDPVYRTVALPSLAVRGGRSWLRLQVATSEPPGTAVHWQVDTGAVRWWHDGAAWVEADGPLAWNTSEEIEAAWSTLATSIRSVTLIAALTTTDARERPEVYGARILYAVRDLGSEDDALVRTLIPALRAAIRSTAVQRYTMPATGSRVAPPEGWGTRYTGAPTVFDLTADPDEESPRSGTWQPTSGVFVLAATIAQGHEVLVEWPVDTRVDLSVHRDGTPEHLPAIYLFPTEQTDRWPGQGEVAVTARHGDEPVGDTMPSASRMVVRLEVRVVAELAADCRRMASELEAWIRGRAVLISPETGRAIGIRSVSPIVTTAGALSAGVIDARGTWEIAYELPGALLPLAVDYLRDGGLTATLIPPEEQ